MSKRWRCRRSNWNGGDRIQRFECVCLWVKNVCFRHEQIKIQMRRHWNSAKKQMNERKGCKIRKHAALPTKNQSVHFVGVTVRACVRYRLKIEVNNNKQKPKQSARKEKKSFDLNIDACMKWELRGWISIFSRRFENDLPIHSFNKARRKKIILVRLRQLHEYRLLPYRRYGRNFRALIQAMRTQWNMQARPKNHIQSKLTTNSVCWPSDANYNFKFQCTFWKSRKVRPILFPILLAAAA